jgi:hypothetical protein
VELTRISQEETEVVLEGLALLHDEPSSYAEALAGLGEFSQVVLQSVAVVEPVVDPEAPAEAEPPQVLYSFEIIASLPAPEPVATAPAEEAAP